MPANKPTRPFARAAAALARRDFTMPRSRGDAELERVPLLVIVAPTDALLCQCVREAFAGAESVRVLLDRRRGDRRHETRAVGVDRRGGERRDRLLIGEQLRSQGWALVHRPPG